MEKLLVIEASGRKTRSISRSLAERFVAGWKKENPDGVVVRRDVGIEPPSAITEHWIAAAFTPESDQNQMQKDVLKSSETFLRELNEADKIVIATPMYNFGMPAQLKAYFDQIIRVGKSFAMSDDAENPYKGLIKDKPTIIIMVAGNGDLLSGGRLEFLNFLEPHIKALLNFIGIHSLQFISVGYAEFKDERFKLALERAETAIDEIVSLTQ